MNHCSSTTYGDYSGLLVGGVGGLPDTSSRNNGPAEAAGAVSIHAVRG